MNKVLYSSNNQNWCTPQAFFDKLNAEFNFVLDAAATDKSAKCRLYYTPFKDRSYIIALYLLSDVEQRRR